MKNEKRFYQSSSDERYTYTKYQELEYGIADNETDKVLGGEEILDLLNFLIKENEQLRKENEQLRQQLKEKEEDEKLYANEIVELRKTNEEWLQFKDLGGDY